MSIRELTPWNWGQKSAGNEQTHSPLLVPQYLHQHLDRMFDEFFGDMRLMPFIGHGVRNDFLAPRIDVAETDEEYRFSVELPDVGQKDVEVTITDDVLTIKGEKKVESAGENKDNALCVEANYGLFQRSFSLPADVDDEKVKATFDKGVLTVTIGKSPAAASKVKKIEVKKAA